MKVLYDPAAQKQAQPEEPSAKTSATSEAKETAGGSSPMITEEETEASAMETSSKVSVSKQLKPGGISRNILTVFLVIRVVHSPLIFICLVLQSLEVNLMTP